MKYVYDLRVMLKNGHVGVSPHYVFWDLYSNIIFIIIHFGCFVMTTERWKWKFLSIIFWDVTEALWNEWVNDLMDGEFKPLSCGKPSFTSVNFPATKFHKCQFPRHDVTTGVSVILDWFCHNVVAWPSRRDGSLDRNWICDQIEFVFPRREQGLVTICGWSLLCRLYAWLGPSVYWVVPVVWWAGPVMWVWTVILGRGPMLCTVCGILGNSLIFVFIVLWFKHF